MNGFSQTAAEIILARYAGTDDYLFLPKWILEQPQKDSDNSMPGPENQNGEIKSLAYVNNRIDVINFDAYIDQMFCVISEKDTEIRNVYHRNQRILVQDLLTLIFTLFPPDKQRAWTNEDFHEASVFFREAYPVTKEMLTVDFPTIGSGRCTKNKEFYNLFREAYTVLAAYEDSPLLRGRERYKEVKKKDKQKKTEEI